MAIVFRYSIVTTQYGTVKAIRRISGVYQGQFRALSGDITSVNFQARSGCACARQLPPKLRLIIRHGSGCSIRRFRSPRDRRAARHSAGRYRNSGPAPRGSLLRPLLPTGPYCCFYAVVFPDRAEKTSELMGCGLRAHRLAQKRKTSPALASCLAKTRLAPLWADALCPRSPCRGSAPAGPGRLDYRIGCFPDKPESFYLLLLHSRRCVLFTAGRGVQMVARPSRRRSYAAGSQYRVPRRQKRIIFCLWHISGPGPLGRLCRAAHLRACPGTALPHGTPASLALAPGGGSVGLSSLPYRFVPRGSSACVAAARSRPAPAQRRRVPHGGTPRLLLLAERPFGLTTLARPVACLGGGLPAGSRASESQLIAGGSRAVSPVRGAPLRRENSQGYAPASPLPCSFFSVALLRPVVSRGLRRLRRLATPVLFGAGGFVRTRREQVPPVRPQPAPEPKQSGAPPISPQSCLWLPPASASSVCRVARPGARLR